MLRTYDYLKVGNLLILVCLIVIGCAPPPESARKSDRSPMEDSALQPSDVPEFDEVEFDAGTEQEKSGIGGGDFAPDNAPRLEPVPSAPKSALRIEPVLEPAADQPLMPTPRHKRSRTRAMSQPPRMLPRALSEESAGSLPDDDEEMAATAAIDPELELTSEEPQAQTTLNVFYATDRKSQSGVMPGDWLKIHFLALLVGSVYLISFAAVFLSKRKVLYGLVALGALAGFLFFGQSATLKWQSLKRLESNNDTVYLSEIRPASAPPLEFGTCEVTIPPNHQPGKVDSPSILKLEFTEDPNKHVVLQRVVRSSKDEFYNGMLNVMDQGRSRQALVFVHGYNVSFESAAKRTAQIAHDLQFEGAPICYSWSSHGSLANYTRDMANADATVLPLQDFLVELVERTGNSTIHLVAHSMGNRALLQALDRIAVSNPDSPEMFEQLVLAAPDVSTHDFRNRFADAAMKLAKSVTLYASSRDRALIAATEVHGHNRAGMAGENLVIMEGMDTIDVSEIDTSLIGHSYYGDHPELIKDLQAVVELSWPASKRNWLTRIISPAGSGYFRFANLPSRSADSDFQPPRR